MGLMKRAVVVLSASLGFVFLGQLAHAQIYKWVDEKGTIHFSENPPTIPEKYKDETKLKTTKEDHMGLDEKTGPKQLNEKTARESDVDIRNNFHAEIVKTYRFQPHTLSQKEIEAKSNDLDQFWNKVKDRKEHYLPLLRAELQAPSNPSFFYYDCSKLLLSLSENVGDRKIALKAIPKADLLDVQHDDYLRTVHMLARDELDTSDAALRILDYPQFKAFIPQHALTLGQNFSLVYMLIPTKE
ncbi:MAG: DUF4124 domain-containing protein, partial [Syntrophales bacterium]